MTALVPSSNPLPVPSGPLGAALQAAFAGLGVDALCLATAAGPEAPVVLAGGCGEWPADTLDLTPLAIVTEVAPRPLDGSSVGAGFAAGIRLRLSGREPFALIALATDPTARTAAWARRFADLAGLVAAVLQARAAGHAALLHNIATHAGPLPERLEYGMAQACRLLRLDAAVLARSDDGVWIPERAVDPSGSLIPREPQPLANTLDALTVRSDGPIGIADVRTAGARVTGLQAYLGTPVFTNGQCYGALSFWGRRPHAGFSTHDRDLVEALGRWAGNALAGVQSSRELAGREAALSSFFNAAPMGMGTVELVTTDRADDIRCVTANAAAAHALGMNPESVVGKLGAETALHPGAIRMWTGGCRRALAGSGRTRFDFVTPEGARMIAVTLARIENEHSDVPQFSFVAEDVTRQRQTQESLRDREEQLKAIFDHLPVSIYTLDADAVFQQVEPSQEAQWIGRSAFVRYADDEPACLAIRRAIAGNRESWTHESGRRTIMNHAVPLFGEDGSAEGALVVAFDGTSAMDALASIHEDREAAAARVRNALLSGLNREIRAPLTTILGYAEMLDPSATPDDLAEAGAVIGRSGRRLLQTLDDFVALALLEADEVQPVATPADATAMIEAVVEEHRPSAQRRGITLRTSGSVGDAPLLLDAALFRRVVGQLVGHAVGSTAGGRVDIAMGIERETLVLAVSDTSGGLGDAAETVFTMESESGVGLAVAQRTVGVLGGTLDVDDRYGEGTTFTVRLPRRPVVLVDLGAPVARPRSAPAAARPGEAGREARASGWR